MYDLLSCVSTYDSKLCEVDWWTMSVPYIILSSWRSVCQKNIKFGGDVTKF